MTVQSHMSHMGIEIQMLGKYLCTGPLQKIQVFPSTPEDEETARGKLTIDIVMVCLVHKSLLLTYYSDLAK